ncbi:MAG: glycosyltransferase family protein [Kiritimatiellia bacterium]
MARIIYGVHGTGHGHAIRALAVARMFPEHEFLFVSHGDGLALLSREHRVFECPNPETIVAAHRVAATATLLRLLRFLGKRGPLRKSLRAAFDRFQPDAAITDYEHFVPIVAREAGIRCLSLDHQHVIPLCAAQVPWFRYPDYLATVWSLRRLFSAAEAHLVTSFFRPPRTGKTNVLPPLLRPSVLRRAPRTGEHVLAYQGYSTFPRFLPFLKQIPGPVVVYGLDRTGRDGNMTFKSADEEEFLDDLASCRYVVCGGGHSLISEALYYGKPVLSVPIRHAIEQYLNAWNVQHLGYGRLLQDENPSAARLAEFEAGLDAFRNRIRSAAFCGNDAIAAAIRHFIAGGAQRPAPANESASP